MHCSANTTNTHIYFYLQATTLKGLVTNLDIPDFSGHVLVAVGRYLGLPPCSLAANVIDVTKNIHESLQRIRPETLERGARASEGRLRAVLLLVCRYTTASCNHPFITSSRLNLIAVKQRDWALDWLMSHKA